MDIRSLIAKMDAIEQGLNEAFNIKTVQQQVGQIQDAEQRHAQLATLAQQNNLPGLYDPADGSFVSANGSTSSTAPHEVDNLLASKGLMPQNAHTSTFLGKMFGTSGDAYDKELRGQSDKVVADQTSAEFKATKFKELQDIMKQLSALKKVDAPKPAATTAATPTTPATPATGQAATPAKESVEFSFASELIESFGYESNTMIVEGEAATLGQQAAVGGATYGGAKVAGKILGKAIPGVGLAFGAADAYNRAKQGDWVGAGLAGVSAGLSLIPGFGWIPAAAIDMFNLGRDLRGPTASAQGAMQHPVENGPIAQLQKIIGTEADGIFGPKSQAALKTWQQQKGLVPDGIPGPKTFAAAGIKPPMVHVAKSAAEQIKETANRLEEINNPQPLLFLDDMGTMFALAPDNQVYELDEGTLSNIWDAIKTGWNGGKVATGALTKAGKPQMVGQDTKAFQKALAARPGLERGAYQTSKFVKNNPIKTAAGLGAAGLGLGYMAGNNSGQGSIPSTGGGGGGQGGTPDVHKPEEQAAQVCSPEQFALIDKARKVMGELSDMANQDPALAQVLQTYQGQIDSLNCGTAPAGGQGATPAAAGGTPLEQFKGQIGKQ